MVKLAPCAGHPLRVTRAVAKGPALLDERTEVAHLRLALGNREVGQSRGDELQVEGTGPPELACQLDGAWIAGETPRLLDRRAQVGHPRSGKPAIEIVERLARSNGREHSRHLVISRRGVVHDVRGDNPDTAASGNLGEGIVAGPVDWVAMVPELHHDVVQAKERHQLVQLPCRCCRPGIYESCRDRSFPAAGEHEEVAAGVPPEPRGVVTGPAFLTSSQVCLTQRSGKARITLRIACQHDQMGASGIWDAGP